MMLWLQHYDKISTFYLEKLNSAIKSSDIILQNVSVSDGKGLSQPACQREWKKYKEEEG
jgi:hypothetical protein